MVKEKTNFVVYEKKLIPLDTTVYVGMGSIKRANEKYRSDDTFNKMVDSGLIKTKISHTGLTEGEAKAIEAILINEYVNNKGQKLFNKNKGTTGYENVKLDEKDNKNLYKSNLDHWVDVVKKSSLKFSIKDRATPTVIANEIIDIISGSKDFIIEGKDILNPNGRLGEIYKQLTDKFGLIKDKKFTIIEKDNDKIAGMLIDKNMNGAKVHDIIQINDDFNNFNTNKLYDIIIMNPPFSEGEKFIKKCMKLLKNGGFLGCVMSQYWRSIGRNEKRAKNKTYNQLRKNGGFHMIHQYSKKQTTEAFNQAIGQVDTFVWQKGVTIDNTEIINCNGDKFYYDLKNFPQAPPVLPSYHYLILFDQLYGKAWKRNTSLRNKGYDNSIEFVDAFTGKIVKCNKRNIELTKVKKIMFDTYLTKYIVDEKGEYISNGQRYFEYETDKERDKIIHVLQTIIDNNWQNLFANKDDIFIPKINMNKN